MDPFIANTIDDLSRHAAEWLAGHIKKVLQQQDRCVIALSGGSTPKKLYELLASPGFAGEIDWSRLHFFWGDERFVPYSDERNNARMAADTLLAKVPVNKDQIHIMRTDMAPQASADAYENILHSYFDNRETSFDIALLGIGGDAHTLSLFPGKPVLHEKKKWVASFFLEEQQMYRITLTVPVINRSACIVFLVSGADKAVAVQHVLYGEHDPELYPAQLIQPYNGNCFWFIDTAAAKEISVQ